ncbi:phosphoribosyl-ATP pyrophosphohydrolase/phosphoribosyl-AMP cyclohydrolase [Deinococcus metalli]|uniref:Histidine biosynthesis bifunctional protein HisIE n=1 Tax=Deinococcus metalli TaxID=1141878 RepID=A0A7W8KIR4_9DEIO|nr:bifunctional phosphoribosyl-AMP cyclohydrolase/phosphoribosyl-ATP diphosphatase HisIE [Deinococcus metalli]MBB5377731.1 phosphoribosyl-ATP pyrophosphohydrolase/phosphoribosyl-AMP cyclohydrolase [Deinococcus metalli]GHF52913.1 histidine biosynthesis bifunctional protein HisIE [Deinococcus metalli]
MSGPAHSATLDDLRFGADGLIPVVTQDARTGAVLMQAYADRAAIERTLDTREATYWSRSRHEQWIKGATSGHTQRVVDVQLDCDGDSVLYRVEQRGPACHTGEYSCFHRPLQTGEAPAAGLDGTLERVYGTISERLATLPEHSYVARLHAGGLDRVLKKIGEEAAEVILAAKNADRAELATEAADLMFHVLFAMAEVGVSPGDVAAVLQGREGKTGLKGPKEVG